MQGGDFFVVFCLLAFSICSSAAVEGLLLLHDVATGTLLLCINHIHAVFLMAPHGWR